MFQPAMAPRCPPTRHEQYSTLERIWLLFLASAANGRRGLSASVSTEPASGTTAASGGARSLWGASKAASSVLHTCAPPLFLAAMVRHNIPCKLHPAFSHRSTACPI